MEQDVKESDRSRNLQVYDYAEHMENRRRKIQWQCVRPENNI